MNVFERFQTLFVFAGAAAGLASARYPGVPAAAERLILPFLMVMLIGAFAQISPGRLRESLHDRRVVSVSLALNFLWNPVLAVGLGAAFLRDHPALWVGLVALLVTPCTDWYLVFTDLAEGDVPLAASLLPFNLLLQLILFPVYLYLFAGALVDLPLGALFESVVIVLVVPLVAASLARRTVARRKSERWFRERVVPSLGPVQIGFLSLAVWAMFASQGRIVVERPELLALMAVPLFVFYVVNFTLGLGVARTLRLSYEETACLNCTILSRNSPTALAIAVVAFPDEPLVPLALVVGPLLELPLLSVVSRVLLRIRARGGRETAPRPTGQGGS